MKNILFLLLLVPALLFAACQSSEEAGMAESTAEAAAVSMAAADVPEENIAAAVFGGGCFWCMEPPFDKLPGVVATTSGYAGGQEIDPTYKEVSSGSTGHTEVVEVRYDSTQISYAELLDVYWRNVDPLTPNRQFCDAGTQYRSAIFYSNAEEKRLAEASKARVAERFDDPVVTEIAALNDSFYPAEEYHQDFYKKNPARYKSYRTGCRRDARLDELWGDDS